MVAFLACWITAVVNWFTIRANRTAEAHWLTGPFSAEGLTERGRVARRHYWIASLTGVSMVSLALLLDTLTR
jgi:hypothetical protein